MTNQKNLSSIIGKSIFFLALFFLINSTATFAQSERGLEMRNKNATPEGKAEKRSQKWKTEFNLTDTQTSQVRVALEKRMKAKSALKGQEKSEEKRVQMKAIKKEFNTTIKGILTAEQYAAYQKKKKENKEKKGRGKGKRKKGKGDDTDFDDFE